MSILHPTFTVHISFSKLRPSRHLIINSSLHPHPYASLYSPTTSLLSYSGDHKPIVGLWTPEVCLSVCLNLINHHQSMRLANHVVELRNYVTASSHQYVSSCLIHLLGHESVLKLSKSMQEVIEATTLTASPWSRLIKHTNLVPPWPGIRIG